MATSPYSAMEEENRIAGSVARSPTPRDDDDKQQQETTSSTDEVQSFTTALAGGSGRSDSSSASGSQRSVTSPTLDPSQYNAMTSSVISALDLGDEHDTHAPAAATVSALPSTQYESEELDSFGTSPETIRAGTVRQSNGAAHGADDSSSNETPPISTPVTAKSSTPLAPHDVLPPVYEPASSYATLPASSSDLISRTTQHAGQSSLASGEADLSGYSHAAVASGDDSALNALMDAHSSGYDHHIHRPSKRDASFGLDPDVDTSHAVQGQPFRPHLLASPLRAGAGSSQKLPHHHAHHRSISVNERGNVYDLPEESAPGHATAATGAPATAKTGMGHTQTVPTVSATGAPRILPRRTSRSPSPSSSSSSSSNAPPPREMQPNYAPSGSLTLALFSPGLGWRRRSYLLLASLAINVGLPFINGVMLGFGEIFARSVVAPWIGLAPAAININAPAGRARAAARPTHEAGSTPAPSSSQRPANAAGVGLRYAGSAKGGA